MIAIDKEYYSSPYYFFLRDKGNKYSLYFSVEETISEARKKDEVIHFEKSKGKKVKSYIDKLTKEKKIKSQKKIKKDLEELVNLDGAISNSKIPILDPRLHPKKTMDQTVAASRITNDPISRGYRTYYGESIEEMSEEDMSGAFGFEETKDMDGKETFKYFQDNLGMDEFEAWERTEEQGKDPSGKRDKKSKFKKDKNFISRQILPEIQKEKAIKMLEDMLAKKKNTDDADISKKEKEEEKEISSMLKRNLKVLIKQAEKENLSKKDIIKLLNRE